MTKRHDRTEVIILTHNYKIKGEIALFPDSRMTDYMVSSKSFIAVTDAEIFDLKGNKLDSSPFLNISRDSIEVIWPLETPSKDNG